MTRKRRRLIFVAIGMLMLSGAAALVLTAFNDNLVFFYSPSDLLAKHDEKYMPPEVAAALKKNGEWRPTTP